MRIFLVLIACLSVAGPIHARRSYYESVGEDLYCVLVIDWDREGFVYMGYNLVPNTESRKGYFEMFSKVSILADTVLTVLDWFFWEPCENCKPPDFRSPDFLREAGKEVIEERIYLQLSTGSGQCLFEYSMLYTPGIFYREIYRTGIFPPLFESKKNGIRKRLFPRAIWTERRHLVKSGNYFQGMYNIVERRRRFRPVESN